jgi:bacterioferritin-associated ferredoxin
MPVTAQVIPIRPTATIPPPIIQAVRATAEEVAAAAEATDTERRCAEPGPAVVDILDSFQSLPGISLESLEKAVFPFASCSGLTYSKYVRITDGLQRSMIVCSCNVLTDHDVRSAVNAAEDLPRNAKQLYGCLGCSAECGRCARTIKGIIEEALGACAKACCSGCPHSQAATESYIHAGFPLETAA